jgi:hypothetical protein
MFLSGQQYDRQGQTNLSLLPSTEKKQKLGDYLIIHMEDFWVLVQKPQQ